MTDHITETELRTRFVQLTEVDLPRHALQHRWPLRLDHCFKRVCLDWACGDCWYAHIERPAAQHLAGDRLRCAVRCAEELLTGDIHLLRARNQASLAWRGKAMPATPLASEPSRSTEA